MRPGPAVLPTVTKILGDSMLPSSAHIPSAAHAAVFCCSIMSVTTCMLHGSTWSHTARLPMMLDNCAKIPRAA